MSADADATSIVLVHGARHLPEVSVASYNEELPDGDGELGDRASKRGFARILTDWRERLRRLDSDPFGDTPTEEIRKKKLDKILAEGDPEAAGLVQAAIGDFAKELVVVLRAFLALKSWRGTQRIVVGGGLRNSRVGELAIGRAAVLVKTDGIDLDLIPIDHHPDEAGLLGAVHLLPSWMMAGHDAILAVDIGGTNIRVGIVGLGKDGDLSGAAVRHAELWRHAEDRPTRDETVERIVGLLNGLVRRATKLKLELAPFIGVGCPGLLRADGTIARGGQNLPGNWESKRFSIAERLRQGLPRIAGHATAVLVHNDAVIQGLSMLPAMRTVRRWGVLTIGTGLGNACFTMKAEDAG